MTDTPSLQFDRSATSSSDQITPGMLEALAKTKPWVRFLSILGFGMIGLIVILGIVMLGTGVFLGVKEGASGYAMAAISLLYFGMALLYFFPARHLFRYASAIGEALSSPTKPAAIEQALRHQKSFWKFAGIMTLVMFLLYIPGIILAIAVPNLLTAMQRSKQKRTMADIRTIASAVESRATDTNSYPSVASLDELARLLEPTYVKKLPRLDGWSNPFQYRGLNCVESVGCDSYVIVSGAKDGAFADEYLNAASLEPSSTDNLDADIVFSEGRFVRYPTGAISTD